MEWIPRPFSLAQVYKWKCSLYKTGVLKSRGKPTKFFFCCCCFLLSLIVRTRSALLNVLGSPLPLGSQVVFTLFLLHCSFLLPLPSQTPRYDHCPGVNLTTTSQ